MGPVFKPGPGQVFRIFGEFIEQSVALQIRTPGVGTTSWMIAPGQKKTELYTQKTASHRSTIVFAQTSIQKVRQKGRSKNFGGQSFSKILNNPNPLLNSIELDRVG
jgi:hypothetical protein